MHRIWAVFLVLLTIVGVGLGVGWMYGKITPRTMSYSPTKNVPPKNEVSNFGNDSTDSNNQSRDLDKILVIAQSPSEDDYGKLINTLIKNLGLKSTVISGNSANLTFSYLTSEGKPSTLSLNVKYAFATGNESYYLGSGPFPFKTGDRVKIQFSHVEKKGDTTNARRIQSIRDNKIATPEQKRAIEVAIGNFGDTVLTRQDLERRLEQGGDVRLEDNEVRVEYLNNLNK